MSRRGQKRKNPEFGHLDLAIVLLQVYGIYTSIPVYISPNCDIGECQCFKNKKFPYL
jgi:hypothetical protein